MISSPSLSLDPHSCDKADEGPAQVVRLGIAALHRFMQRRSCHFLTARPIASLGPAIKPNGSERGWYRRMTLTYSQRFLI